MPRVYQNRWRKKQNANGRMENYLNILKCNNEQLNSPETIGPKNHEKLHRTILSLFLATPPVRSPCAIFKKKKIVSDGVV